jgi:DNA-binding CsgD family transcriptional regulator
MEPTGVTLDKVDRDVAILLAAGDDPKIVADHLDMALSTAYRLINGMCARAHVAGRAKLLIWILQHPGCLFKGVISVPGLHVQPCECGSPYCLGMIAAQLPPIDEMLQLPTGAD